ncbi:ARM repeat-containing protein [Mycena olivaceomarginata]|nr:ARM repeat-containing protein [Mycena olivaceomarginata]
MASTSSPAADSVEQLVTTWMVSGRDEELAAAVAEVSEGRLLGVVKALGTYLTSEQDDLRTKGVDFLATVITRRPQNALNRQSVKVLTAFFCDKLDDTETIVPALKGLASLPPICSSSDALVMINAVFAHVKMRALVQSVRFHVFTIIDGLIANHRETLKGMKKDFIAPYISLAEGEKDPRNLLVAFAIARVILIEFDPTDHIEALSNIVFCYFPITFRAPGERSLRHHTGRPADCITIFQPTDSATEEAALVAMQALVVTIHAEDDAQDEDLQGLARDACEECIGILPSVSRYTLAHAVPHLLKLFADPNEVPSRHPILLLLSDLIAAARDSIKAKSTPEEPILLFAPFKDEVLGALISGVATLATTRAALAGLTGLVSTPHLLSDAELGFVVLKVNDVLETCLDEEHSDDRSAILKLLNDHLTLPLLLGSLPASAPPREAVAARARYQHVLSALSTLCGPAPALRDPPNGAADDPELRAAYLHALLAALKRTLAGKADEGHADVAAYADTLVPALYGVPRVVGVVGEIVGLVVQSTAPARQQAFAAVLFPAFLSGKIVPLCAAEHVSIEDKFFPFAADATTAERNLLVLFEAGVVPLHPSVTIDADINACTETILVQGLAHTDTDRQAEAVFRTVGSIVNKHVDELGPFLEHKTTVYWAERIQDSAGTPAQRRQAIRVWTWLCKALLVRSHARALPAINRLFDVFGDATVGTDAAKAFGDIAAADGVLTKRNAAVVRFLWAQKFATGMLPRLMGGARDERDPALQHANLIALTALIKAIPNAAYAHEMTQLLPLLLRALLLPDAQIRANVIETLLAAAAQHTSTHAVLAEHAPALARQMLAYTKPGAPVTSTRIRISALRYLGVLPAVVRYAVLHPVKAEVLRELAAALDDPRRGVRREAVDARFKYSG